MASAAPPPIVPAMRRLLRRLAYGLAVILLLLIAGATGGLLWLRQSLPQTAGTLYLDGLRGPVAIRRDADGIPHIRAGSEADASFALGFVHAQDRLWQMEAMRRYGQGRLSEIVGPATLELDRTMRILGLYRVAEGMAERLPPDLRTGMDAYAAGVNAYIAHRRGPLPPEFLLLGHRPEPWRAADSLVWSRLMALQLSVNWHREIDRAVFATILPPERLDQLWPDDPPGSAVSIQAAAAIPATDWAALGKALSPLPSDIFGASNAWAIGGMRTASGRPILANDPHLGFMAPGTWYLARIEMPGLTLSGATAPGVPLMILGHNGTAAWGMTSTGGDVQDLFVERIDPSDPTRYLTPDGPMPFQTRTETIGIKGVDPASLTIRSTRHGPVVSDLAAGAPDFGPGTAVALATTMFDPADRTAEGLYRLNQARSWADFEAAAALFQAPLQHVFYADIDGDFGMIMAGAIPIRRSGDGRGPVPGWTGQFDWTGFVPAAENPRTHNPAGGSVANANNRTVDADYPYPLGSGWDASYRADRIREVLAGRAQHDAADSHALQTDILSPAARELLPRLLALADPGDGRAAILDLLRGWDFAMRRDRPEPLIYAGWLTATVEALAADDLRAAFPEFAGQRARFVGAVLERNTAWCDDIGTPETEDCAARVTLALDRALASLKTRYGPDPAQWRWGDAHRALFRNRVLGQVPLAGPWLASPEIATDGGDFTVNRGQTSGGPPEPFRHVHGAGYRAVYDLADLDASLLMIAPGQSGNPFSPHYADLLERWRDGDALTLGTAPADAETLHLMPRSERRE
ncbi:MAG: penicillin acylase family protein [Alphaproteobacteria bacterium]